MTEPFNAILSGSYLFQQQSLTSCNNAPRNRSSGLEPLQHTHHLQHHADGSIRCHTHRHHPPPFKNLTYSNMVVTDMTTATSCALRPFTGKHYIVATNQWDFRISGANPNSFGYTLASLALGCTGCTGTNCAGGQALIACNITAVSVTTAGLPTCTTQLSYVPQRPASGQPTKMQKLDLKGAGVGGEFVHFSLAGGNGQTNIFFDQLVSMRA